MGFLSCKYKENQRIVGNGNYMCYDICTYYFGAECSEIGEKVVVSHFW